MLTGDAWAADDLVQDTLERACSKWLLWRSGSDLRAWLFTLMHNLYLNQRRGSPPLAAVDIDEVRDYMPGPQAPRPRRTTHWTWNAACSACLPTSAPCCCWWPWRT